MREPFQPSQIRALREAAGLEPDELAMQLGVPLENVLIWEATYDLVYLDPAMRDRLLTLAHGHAPEPTGPGDEGAPPS